MTLSLEQKTCSKCKIEKPISEFWRRSTKADPEKRRSWCISCCQKRRPYQDSYDPEYRRAWHLAQKYGITQEDYVALLSSQGGTCAICLDPPSQVHFHIDHDHDTGEVRGILCSRCNAMIGYGRDNPAILFSGIFYLLNFPSSREAPSSMLAKAYAVAANAHEGHVRKDGSPYINHPLRVAMNVSSDLERTVALLHDTVEDSMLRLQDLKAMGFSQDILKAVDAVTKRPGEVYTDFILRCKAAGPIAIAVKLADIEDNLEDQSALDPDEAAFLKKRYIKAQEVLLDD